MNKILTIALLIMLAFTTIALFATKENNSALPPDSSSGTAAIGGMFNLIDQDGKAVSDADYRGKYMLVFFGFTHCPEICPLAMANITAAMSALGEKAGRITPILITVDPARDTPEVIKNYLGNFDKRIVGLTGSDEQVKAAAAAYKAYYSEDAHGMMNHSAILYLMNEKGEYVQHFAHDTAPDTLAQRIAEQMP